MLQYTQLCWRSGCRPHTPPDSRYSHPVRLRLGMARRPRSQSTGAKGLCWQKISRALRTKIPTQCSTASSGRLTHRQAHASSISQFHSVSVRQNLYVYKKSTAIERSLPKAKTQKAVGYWECSIAGGPIQRGPLDRCRAGRVTPVGLAGIALPNDWTDFSSVSCDSGSGFLPCWSFYLNFNHFVSFFICRSTSDKMIADLIPLSRIMEMENCLERLYIPYSLGNFIILLEIDLPIIELIPKRSESLGRKRMMRRKDDKNVGFDASRHDGTRSVWLNEGERERGDEVEKIAKMTKKVKAKDFLSRRFCTSLLYFKAPKAVVKNSQPRLLTASDLCEVYFSKTTRRRFVALALTA